MQHKAEEVPAHSTHLGTTKACMMHGKGGYDRMSSLSPDKFPTSLVILKTITTTQLRRGQYTTTNMWFIVEQVIPVKVTEF